MAPDERFVRAERVLAAVQERMERDPAGLPPRLRLVGRCAIADRLWALRRHAREGSSDTARAAGDYAGRGQRLCACLTASGRSRLAAWQMLGELSAVDARAEFVRMVDALLPSWDAPPPPAAAMLCAWTPDDASDACAACAKAFTLLRRRHHLVCAACSPHALPLRVLSQWTARPQRLCGACYALVARGDGPSERDDNLDTTADADADADAGGTRCGATPDEIRYRAVSTPPTEVHSGPLELLLAAGEARASWRACFFVLLVRKGALGMFPAEEGPPSGGARPSAVFKLSGYALTLRARRRRPHQFRLAHAAKQSLQLAAAGVEDLRAWLAALQRAIEAADTLERA